MAGLPGAPGDDWAPYDDDELLALSGIQHLAFCERQWALINIECLWRENVDTTLGEVFHERAHLAGYSVADGVIAERSVPIVSRRLGLIGYSDIVEYTPTDMPNACVRNGVRCSVSPVEYKKGRAKAGDCDRLQVAAQALCLEEMLQTRVEHGFLFYGETRRRERVAVDDGLRRLVLSAARRMHELERSGAIPKPALRPCCARCSLTSECMPEASGRDASDYWRDAGVDWGKA